MRNHPERDVSSGSICKWGNGVSPTVRNIKRVANILGCTVDDLLVGCDNSESEDE